MVLGTVRREAGPQKRRPRTLKGELENNSRKPRDVVRNWHSDSLSEIDSFLVFWRIGIFYLFKIGQNATFVGTKKEPLRHCKMVDFFIYLRFYTQQNNWANIARLQMKTKV
jgi:hypothetical protein